MDYDSNYAGAARRGKEKAYGFGGVKLKFSDKITSERLRYPINNGDKFDGLEIGDLSINEHSDSRSKLADNWVRQEDQTFFDAGQGYLRNFKPTHGFRFSGKKNPGEMTAAADKYNYDGLIKLETAMKTGKGFTVGGARRPMKVYQGEAANNGVNPTATYLIVMATQQAADIKLDDKFQRILSTADSRGRNNMALQGLVGKVGNSVYMEAPAFMGYEDEVGNNNFGKTVVEMSGLRRCAVVKGATGTEDKVEFEGTEAYDALVAVAGTIIFDRGLILGAGAFSQAIGMDPDYKFQSSEDFGIDSESMMEYWGNVQPTILTPENGDHKVAKIADMTFGLAYLDTFVEETV